MSKDNNKIKHKLSRRSAEAKIVRTKPSSVMVNTNTSDEDNDGRSMAYEQTTDTNASKRLPNNDSALNYTYTTNVRQNRKQHIYSVQFNRYLLDEDYFATVDSNLVTVYRCDSDGSVALLQCFSDASPDEVYYTCVWSYDDITGHPLIITAGLRGVIRVIDCGLAVCVGHLTGHGFAINDLKISAIDHHLLASASRDYSIRLWNIKTYQCMAIFGGVNGHRDQVLSVDFHLTTNTIISCGMDHTIMIWSLNKPEIKKAISDSMTADDKNRVRPVNEPFPCYTNRDIHDNYIDCIQWMGNFVLSKASRQNEIICWQPINSCVRECLSLKLSAKEVSKKDESIFYYKLLFEDSNLWFMKFSLNEPKTVLAAGNEFGVTYLWNVENENASEIEPKKLTHLRCTKAIRQTSFSNDSSILICVCDDSTIWRWDLNKNN